MDINDTIKRLDELDKKATPKPWECQGMLPECYVVYPKGLSNKDFSTKTAEEFFANVSFIEESREAIPALISEIRRLKGENGLLKERLEQTKSILLACSQSVDDLEARLKEVEGGGA